MILSKSLAGLRNNSLYCQNFYDLIAKKNHKIGKNDENPTFLC